MYYVEQIATVEEVHHFGCKAEFHSIKIKGHDVRMQNDTGSSVTIISTKIWREIGSPTLSTSPRWIEAYDGHRMLYLSHLKCEIPWEKKKFIALMLQLFSPKKKWIDRQRPDPS